MTPRCWMFATALGICASPSLPQTLPAQGNAAGAAPLSRGQAGVAPPSRPADQAANQARLHAQYARLPLAFEANRGQTDAQVKFLSRGAGYTLFLTSGEAVLSLRSRTGSKGPLSLVPRPSHAITKGVATNDQGPMTKDSVLTMRLAGANTRATVSGVDELPGKSNYFIGDDPKKWRTNVANYAKVRYQNVYPGIDLVYYGNQGGRLEYDFVVAPGADPSAIKLYVGALGENSRQMAVGRGQLAVGSPGRHSRRHAVGQRALPRDRVASAFECGRLLPLSQGQLAGRYNAGIEIIAVESRKQARGKKAAASFRTQKRQQASALKSSRQRYRRKCARL